MRHVRMFATLWPYKGVANEDVNTRPYVGVSLRIEERERRVENGIPEPKNRNEERARGVCLLRSSFPRKCKTCFFLWRSWNAERCSARLEKTTSLFWQAPPGNRASFGQVGLIFVSEFGAGTGSTIACFRCWLLWLASFHSFAPSFCTLTRVSISL